MKTDVEDNSVKGFPASALPQIGLSPAVSPGCRCLADSAGCIGRNRCSGWLGGDGEHCGHSLSGRRGVPRGNSRLGCSAARCPR